MTVARRLLLHVLAFVVLTAFVQDVAASCQPLCEPDPAGSGYTTIARSRTYTFNARKGFDPQDPVDPMAPAKSGPSYGSESFSYTVPLFSLTGRNGLNVNMALYHNSRAWNRSGTIKTFNEDRDYPSYGFRLGYGYLEFVIGNNPPTDNVYILSMPNGSKNALLYTGSDNYNTQDGSYIHYRPSTKTLTLKNGTKMVYEAFKANTNPTNPTFFRPIKIIDTHGNYITIAYRANTDQSISTITDTLGRVIDFNYGTGNDLDLLTSIAYGPTGQRQIYTLSYEQRTMRFEYTGTVTSSSTLKDQPIRVLVGVMYPDQTFYRFIYSPDPNSTDTNWGLVHKIEYYSKTAQLRSSVSYNFPAPDPLNKLSVPPTFTQETIFNGLHTVTRDYSTTKTNGLVSTVTVTDPANSSSSGRKQIVTTLFTTADFKEGLTDKIEVKDYATGTTLRTTKYTWGGGPNVIEVLNTLHDTNQQSKTVYEYTTYGNLSVVKEYDFGLVLKRTTTISYQTATAYVNAHILHLPLVTAVKDENGTVVAKSENVYDGFNLATASGATNHDYTNYPATQPQNPPRGDVTTVKQWYDIAGNSYLSRNFKYDEHGNLIEADLDCCNKRTWTYDSALQYAFSTSSTAGPSGGPNLTTSATYDTSTFWVTSTTDENGLVTNFAYDAYGRPTMTTRAADNATFHRVYDDESALPVNESYSSLSPARAKSYAQSGKMVSELWKGTQSTDLVSKSETFIDEVGRAYKTSNPFLPGQTPVYTVTEFDQLNRPTKVTPPSGGFAQYSYSGNSVTTTDPAGKTKRMFTSAQGKLVRVDEPGWDDGTYGSATIAITGELQYASHMVCNQYFCDEVIDYYDDGMVGITVGGRTHSVAYSQSAQSLTTLATALKNAINADSMRLVNATSSGANITLTARYKGADGNFIITDASSSNRFADSSFDISPNPKQMTGGADPTNPGAPSLTTPMVTSYLYDALGNLTQVQQAPQTRTYTYDALGRVTSTKTPESVNASNVQVATTYAYDPVTGLLDSKTDARGVTTYYDYDGLNRLVKIDYPNTGSYAVSADTEFTYGTTGWAKGKVLTMTDASGSTAYSYGDNSDPFGRLTKVTKTISGTAYDILYHYNAAGQLDKVTYPSGLEVNQEFDSMGRLTRIYNGATDYLEVPDPAADYGLAGELKHFVYGNGVEANFTYNDRYQIASLLYEKADGTDLLNLAYGYGTANNGQIAQITNALDGTKSQKFTYDAWGRLDTAQAGPDGSETWKLGYAYDRFGNRRQQNPIAGSSGPSSQLTIDTATNRVQGSGISYDFNGNMTADGTGFHTYTYDATNMMKTVDGTAATYTYDGGSLRVKKVVGSTTTVYVFSGSKVIAEYVNGTLDKEYIYAGGQLLATKVGTALTYVQPDHLSTRVETDSSGNVTRTYGHYPFGEDWYETGSSNLKFTSYERDSESLLDYAMMRQDSSRLGRFMSPDPVAGSLLAPQTMNRFSYTYNDPVNLVDPTGLRPPLEDCQGKEMMASCGGFNLDMWGLPAFSGLAETFMQSGIFYTEVTHVYGQTWWNFGSGGEGADGVYRAGSLMIHSPWGYLGSFGSNDFYLLTQSGSSGGASGPSPQDWGKLPCDEKFIKQMGKAVMATNNGTADRGLKEAGFLIEWMNGSFQFGPIVHGQPADNLKVRFTLTPNTVGIFHVHPNNAVPTPSGGDIALSSSKSLPIYVGSTQTPNRGGGLYVTDPSNSNPAQTFTPIRSKDWTKKCK